MSVCQSIADDCFNATMEEDLVGRIEQMKLAQNRALYPVFEAISNSLHAIEGVANGEVSIEIHREFSGQPTLDPEMESLEPIVEFQITDNGVGLDDDNMEAFN